MYKKIEDVTCKKFYHDKKYLVILEYHKAGRTLQLLTSESLNN